MPLDRCPVLEAILLCNMKTLFAALIRMTLTQAGFADDQAIPTAKSHLRSLLDVDCQWLSKSSAPKEDVLVLHLREPDGVWKGYFAYLD